MLQVRMKNSRFSTNIGSITAGWSRVITIWMIMTVLAYCTWADDDDDDGPCRRNKQYQLMNVTATHQWTIVDDASHRSYVENKLSKKPFCILPPIWRPLKTSRPKGEKTCPPCPDDISTVMQTFTSIGGHTFARHKEIKQKIQQMIYPTKRILALRSSDNKRQ